MVVDKKKQKALALLCLGLLPNAADSSDVPTEFAAELKKEKVLKDKFQFVTWTFPIHFYSTAIRINRFTNYYKIVFDFCCLC